MKKDFSWDKSAERYNRMYEDICGGAGAGVNITPVAFLVVRGESVRMLPVAEPASTSMDRLIEQLPDLLDKAESLMKQKRLAKEEGIE